MKKVLISFVLAIVVIFFATCISGCKKEKEVTPSLYTKSNWFFSLTNPYIDSTTQIPVGSANLYVMFKGTENRCETAWKGPNGDLGRDLNTGKYSYGPSAVSVPLSVEQDCKRIMEKDKREYMVFVKPLNPYTDYEYDYRYKTESKDTLNLETWKRIN